MYSEFKTLYFGVVGLVSLISIIRVAKSVKSAASYGITDTGKLFRHISDYRLPTELKDQLIHKVDEFPIPEIGVTDLLAHISIQEEIYPCITRGKHKERRFSLYPDFKSVPSDFPRFVATTDFAVKTNALLIPSRSTISYYSITKVHAGFLEAFFVNNRLTVTLNESVLGYFDYNSKKLCDADGHAKASFDIPSRPSSIGPIKTGVESSVYADDRKIADILLLLSSSKKNEETNASGPVNNTKLFDDLNVRSEWEAYMLLAFAISEYAFARTTFGVHTRTVGNHGLASHHRW
ncbi:hypothetical protein [Methanolobus psychrotolerans]|uniref:hypothetical protein n=1 Tax=Methanolobus psychrotolerans TaxID=1874706 RepID=UPI000B91CD79|nr:hypothetical protein [Methanolobus psychrotolerans]